MIQLQYIRLLHLIWRLCRTVGRSYEKTAVIIYYLQGNNHRYINQSHIKSNQFIPWIVVHSTQFIVHSYCYERS